MFESKQNVNIFSDPPPVIQKLRLLHNYNNLKLHYACSACWFTIETSRSIAVTHFSSFGRPVSQKWEMHTLADFHQTGMVQSIGNRKKTKNDEH